MNLLETEDYKLHKDRVNVKIQEKYNLKDEEIFCIQRFWIGFNKGGNVDYEALNNKDITEVRLIGNISYPKAEIIKYIVDGIKKFPKYQSRNLIYRIIKSHNKIEQHNGRMLISFTDNLDYVKNSIIEVRNGHDELNTNFYYKLLLEHHENMGYDLREISNTIKFIGSYNTGTINESEIVFLGDEVYFNIISERVINQNLIEQYISIKS